MSYKTAKTGLQGVGCIRIENVHNPEKWMEKPSDELCLKLAASTMYSFFLVKRLLLCGMFFLGLFTTAVETHDREAFAFF